MKGETQVDKWKIIERIFFMCAILLLLSRLLFDVVLGDESFYLGMADRILKGSRPFYEMYEPTQSFTFFLLPFLALYKMIVGSLDGGIIFLRLLYFVYCIVISYCMYSFIKRRVFDGTCIKYLTIIVIFYAPFSLYCVSYNSMADVLIMVFALLIWGILYDDKAAKPSTFLCAGVTMAFAALAYPTLIFLCFLMTIFVFIIAYFNRKSVKAFIYNFIGFCVGGAGVATVVVLILLLYVGKAHLIEGIRSILADPLYTIQSQTNFIQRIQMNLGDFLKTTVWDNGYLFVLLVILVSSFFQRKHPKLRMLLFLIPCYSFMMSYSSNTIVNLRIIQFVGMMSVAIPFLLLFAKEQLEKTLSIFVATVVPCWSAYLIICSSSAGSGLQSSHIFFAEVIGMGGLYYLIFKDFFQYKNVLKIIWTIVFPGFFLILFLTSSYTRYPIYKMDHVIKDGIYQGLRTNKEVYDQVEFIQDNIDKMEEKNKSVLILPNGYAIYPMLNMKVCAPTTWGLYSYWYPRNEQVFIDYFNKFQCKPDRVILYYNEKIYGMDLWEAWYPVMMKQFYEKEYKLIWTSKAQDGSVITVYDKK